MKSLSVTVRLVSFLLLAAFAMPGVLLARPIKPSIFVQQDEVKKLPPVNWIRSRKIDVKHVDINLRFDWEKSQALGVTTVTLAPFGDTAAVTLDAAMMTINSVTLAGGPPLKFTYDGERDGDNLEITLDRVYRSGEDVKVTVDYATNYVNKAEGDTAIGIFGRGLRFIKPTEDHPTKPRQIWSQGESEFNRYWFPSYDSPNDFRTSELRATVAKPFFVVSNGKLMETKENADNTRTFYWKMDVPYTNYLTSIVVSETTPVVQDFEGIPVYNYGYVNETKEVAVTVRDLPDNMKFFSQVLGIKYPYAKYSQAFVEDFGGGMENISATTMIEEMIHDEREMLDGDSNSLQAHELAHQWFGDLVTCRDWGQIWLNESFATYFDALYHEHSKGHDDFLYNNVRGNQQQYFNAWNSGNRRPIVTNRYANKDAMFDTYSYPRGAAVLHMLRKHLGDKLFYKSLNHYLVTNMHQPVSTEDLRIAIEETTGQSMDWFFDQWLYKMGHPVFEVTKAYDEAGKKLTLNVKQTQKIDATNEFPQVEFFQSNVDVAIDGRVSRVWLKPQAENIFVLDAPTKPRIVSFDHEGTLIKEIKFEKSVDDLIYQMREDKDILGRRWAMGELAAKAAVEADKPRVVAALVTSAENDKSWRMRRGALSFITTIYAPNPPEGQEEAPVKLDPATEAAVLRLTKDAQSLVRADAIELLGRTGEAKLAGIYLAALNDRSYGVIDQAATALGATKDPRAYDALRKLTTTPSWKGRIQIAGLNGLAELADGRGFDTGFKIATDKSLSNNIRTTALAVVGATGQGDQRAFPLIFEMFKRSLAVDDFNGLQNTVTGLISIADPRGQEAFEMLKAKYKDQSNIMGFVMFLEAQFKAALKP